jgi:hypothetical protein
MHLPRAARRHWFACGVGLLVAAAAGSAAFLLGRAEALRGLYLRPVPAAAAADDVRCGPRSLWVSALRLGVPVAVGRLAEVPVHPVEGASLGDLKAAAHKFGLRARTAEVSFEELARHPGTAVLFVRGNHFVAADPREQDPAKGSARRLRVYDSDKLAAWWPREELEAVWSGVALLLERPEEGPAAGPRLRWDTCWQDCGVVQDADVARFSFALRNTGAAPLTVEISHSSCQCTTAKLTAKTVPPGGTASLLAQVALTTSRGPFTERVEVRSNDPDRPLTSVVLGGGATNELVSARAMHWGSVRPGQAVTQRFVVYDPGQGRLSVEGVEWAPWPAPPGAARPACRLTARKVRRPADAAKTLSPPVKVNEGDYLVEAELTVPEGAAPGRVGGTVWVRTNLPGKWAKFDVTLEGQVLSDLEASPAAVVLSGAEPSAAVTVRVKSVLGKPVTVEKVEVTGGIPVQAGRARGKADGSAEVSVRLTGEAARSREGAVVCHLRGGRSLTVPVVIVP